MGESDDPEVSTSWANAQLEDVQVEDDAWGTAGEFDEGFVEPDEPEVRSAWPNEGQAMQLKNERLIALLKAQLETSRSQREALRNEVTDLNDKPLSSQEEVNELNDKLLSSQEEVNDLNDKLLSCQEAQLEHTPGETNVDSVDISK